MQGLLAAAGVFVTQDEVVSLLRHDMQLEQQRSKRSSNESVQDRERSSATLARLFASSSALRENNCLFLGGGRQRQALVLESLPLPTPSASAVSVVAADTEPADNDTAAVDMEVGSAERGEEREADEGPPDVAKPGESEVEPSHPKQQEEGAETGNSSDDDDTAPSMRTTEEVNESTAHDGLAPTDLTKDTQGDGA